jgi:hypothetical protein
MTATGYSRGHPIRWDGQTWAYADDGSPATVERPCVKCHITADPGAPDPCLGTLPGVHSACCGHGAEEPYLALTPTHPSCTIAPMTTDQTKTTIIPWASGRGVSYVEALEAEVLALRAVIDSLHNAGRIVPGPMPFMRHSPADQAYDRALGRDIGS